MSEEMLQPAIVLIETSHPGNIGATARAMKNMGLHTLRLVNPKQFPCAEATARASGADDVLAAAQKHESIDAAIADATLVIGASARSRSLPVPLLDPRGCAELVRCHPESEKAVILFGRERTGLTNDELDRCQHLVQIPVSPDYPSLNIAAAVQVICYELRMAALSNNEVSSPDETDYATALQMEQFYQHLEQTLIELEFLNPENPRQLMRRLRRLYNRARPDQNEVNILRGILTAANRKSS
ncbi:tRNA (cytidine(32)/uridine(32)-2'-O)-methyltransferase [hydrothermal vent metagenome]|uniref:tRNA (Cytidine(32)/uridine(32)-2'-O)-methyltransferase n=1 Tax=hydrothermal vent metagenome TaxID=652676 RepID=A0A3B0YI45_9ZZZZ